MNKPQGAQHFAYGQWFKTGAHNLLMRWAGDQWVRSSLNLTEVRREGRSVRVETANNSGRRPIPLINGKKRCGSRNGCGQLKDLGDFQKGATGYYFSHCKSCEKKRQQQYRVAA